MDCKVIFLNEVIETKKAMGPGRQLQVSAPQRDGVVSFSKTQIANVMTVSSTVEQPMPAVSQAEVMEPVVENIQPSVPVEEVTTVSPEPTSIDNVVSAPIPEVPTVTVEQPIEVPVQTSVVSEPVMEPVAEIPVVETPVMPEVTETPVVSPEPVSQGVEIVSEAPASSKYDELIQQLDAIDLACDQKISAINAERKEKKEAILGTFRQDMIAAEMEASKLYQDSREYLKNAEAAKQIAITAEQNAINIQNSQVMTSQNTMDNVIPFPTEVPTADMASLESAPVLAKVA